MLSNNFKKRMRKRKNCVHSSDAMIFIERSRYHAVNVMKVCWDKKVYLKER